MTFFVETGNWRTLVNVADIVKMWDEHRDEKGQRRTVAELRDGTTCTIGVRCQNVAQAVCPVIPAAPGFEMLSFWLDGNGTAVTFRQPIIGWRITACGPEAIVLDDDEDIENMETGFIKYPDGQVCMPGGASWANDAAWFEQTSKDARERKAHVKG